MFFFVSFTLLFIDTFFQVLTKLLTTTAQSGGDGDGGDDEDMLVVIENIFVVYLTFCPQKEIITTTSFLAKGEFQNIVV